MTRTNQANKNEKNVCISEYSNLQNSVKELKQSINRQMGGA